MKAYLILQDGKIFEGTSIGVAGEAIGEVVFTTGMGAYMETLTDPSYVGQIITQTFPLIGNYGAISEDTESHRVYASGYIVRELCQTGSNFRKEGELNDFLISNGVVAIAGIDTRELTRHLRENGTMNGMITTDASDLEGKQKRIAAYKIKGAVELTSCKQVSSKGNGSKHVVLWDFGAKLNIERELLKRDLRVTVVPYSYTAEQILSLKPHGVLVSNGGGSPTENKQAIEDIRKLLQHKMPLFGICLGHQMISLALGGKIKKLKYGHRGANQPVKDIKNERVYITCQNHSYAVVDVPQDVSITMVNANDKTCEAIEHNTLPVLSVQFHPEACGGPHDTAFLFDKFARLLG